jgi:hypothetical protein
MVRPRSCRVIYYFDTPTLEIRHQLFDRVKILKKNDGDDDSCDNNHDILLLFLLIYGDCILRTQFKNAHDVVGFIA